MLDKIHSLRQRYYKSSAGKEELLKIIAQSEASEQVYDSNAIENSTLNLEETEKILLEIELDRYISQREIFETKNLSRVINYINKTAKTKELDIDGILLIHKMLISNIDDEIAGRFRQNNEFVKVGTHIAPAPKNIENLLQDMMTQYYSRADINIASRIALLHLTFENIHPFIDGNDRIGRVLNNYLLIREGYVPINIKFIDRKQYYQAFTEFDQSGKTKIMEKLIASAITNSYHKRLAYLEEKSIISLLQFAKKNKLSYSNLLNKANRQTIEAFSERGVWKIGIDNL